MTQKILIDGEVAQRYTLHSFKMAHWENGGEFDGVAIAAPLHEWKQTPPGKFCMEKGRMLEYHHSQDYSSMHYNVIVTGYMTERDYTFLSLIKD